MTEASSSIVERIRALEGAGITDVFIKKRVPSYAAQAAAIGDSIQNNYSDSLLVPRPKTTKIYQNPANFAPNHSVSSLNSSLSSPPNRHSEPEHDEHEPINHFSNIIPDIYQHSPSVGQRTSSRNELNASFNRAPSIDSIQNEIKSEQVDYRVSNLVNNLSDARQNLRHVSTSQLDHNSLNIAPLSATNPDDISVQVPASPSNVSNSSSNSVFKYAKSDSIAMEPRLQVTSAGSMDNMSNLNVFNPLGSKMSSFNTVAKNQLNESKTNSVNSRTGSFKHELNPSNVVDPIPSIHDSRKNSTSTNSSFFRQELNQSNIDPNLSVHESRKSSTSVLQMYETNREPSYSINYEARKNSVYSNKSSETSKSSSNHLNTWIKNDDESRKSSTSTLKADLSPSNSFSSGLNNSNKERSNSININNNNNSYNQSNKRLLIYNNNNNNYNQVTKAMSQTIHPEHFACWNCDTSLTGSRYILRDDHPYCIRCYEDMFAHECEECHKKIGTDSKDLSYKEKHWHEKCFFCHVCKLPLVDKPFGNKNDSLYCSECYNQAFASRCDKCAQIFKPGMKKMEYKGQQFHETCFLCYSCNSTIGTKSFIPKENRIYCVPCYENNFATKCTECMKVISQGGVSYKNQPYHKECFVCTHCQQSLAGQRFTSREDHPYCSDCFGKLFAKKCFACHKPITGIGGTKYISFEDRHWHNECFVCNRCNSSLVGRGFLTDAMDILCPDCGKNES